LIQHTGYRIKNARLQETGYRMIDSTYRIQGSIIKIQDKESYIQDTGYRMIDSTYRYKIQ